MNDTTQTPLEQAISVINQDDAESLRNVLMVLVTARVKLLLNKPWDGTSPPQPGTRMLYVSDGTDQRQPMLAVFTSDGFIDEFKSGDHEFIHLAEVDARFAIHRVEPGTGIMINPNSNRAFRITPELATTLRQEIHRQYHAMKSARSQA
jgi:hypothetical protein